MAGRDLFAGQQVGGRDLLATQQPTREQQLAELRQEMAEEMGPFESFAVGAGRGLYTLGRGVGLVDPGDPAEEAGYKALEEASPTATAIGEAVGEAAPFLLPGTALGKIAHTGARVAGAAALGAAEGGVIASGRDESIGTGAGVGGVVAGTAEALFPVIGRMGGKLFRRVMGKAPESELIDAAGKATPEFQQALDKAGLTMDDLAKQADELVSAPKGVDPQQAARKAFLEKQGLKPLRAQVTRGASDFQAQEEAAKTSSRVREALEGQEAVLTNRFGEMVERTKGIPGKGGDSIQNKIINKATKLDNEIHDLYRQAQKRVSAKLTREPTITMYHGSPEQSLKIEGKGIFGGVFGSQSRSEAGSHGKYLHEIEVPEGRILSQRDLEYSVDYDKASRILRKEINNVTNDEFDEIWKMVVEDKGAHSIDLPEERISEIFSADDLAEADWAGQKARGVIAKKLGYDAVEMADEHGTTYLLLPGAQKSGDLGGVRLKRLLGSLDASKADNVLTKGVVESVRGNLDNLGLIDEKGGIAKAISVEDAEKVRQHMNAIFASTNDFGRTKIRQFKDAIDEDVLSAAGEDIFKQARAAKSSFERELSKAKISKFDKSKRSLVRDILENKETVHPDKLVNSAVFGARTPEELYSLKKYVGKKSKAWDNLRADVMQEIMDRSFSGAEDAAGVTTMTAPGLDRAIKKIGKKKLNIMFSGEERKFLNDMSKVARIRRPVRGTGIGKGPSAQAIASLESRLSKLPVLGQIIETIDLDPAGRLAVKATPRIAPQAPGWGREIGADITQLGLIPAAVAATGDE